MTDPDARIRGSFGHGMCVVLLSVLACLHGTPGPARGQDSQPAASPPAKQPGKKQGKKKDKGNEEPQQEPTMADAIGNVTPVGRGHRELVIPQFDSITGKRSSTIRVASVEREDEVTLRLRGLDVMEFGADGGESMRIEVRSGTFDLITGILTGDSLSRVSVPGQFEIVGAGLVCDTSTREVDGRKTRAQFGRMQGPVRMTIFGGGGMALVPARKTGDHPAKMTPGAPAPGQPAANSTK